MLVELPEGTIKINKLGNDIIRFKWLLVITISCTFPIFNVYIYLYIYDSHNFPKADSRKHGFPPKMMGFGS